MNKVELHEADAAAARRMNAPLGDADAAILERNDVVAVFAGTDLPGHEVLRILGEQINGHLPALHSIGVEGFAQGLTLNAFMLGYECGKRSK